MTDHEHERRKRGDEQTLNLNLTVKIDAPILEHGVRDVFRLLHSIERKLCNMPTKQEFLDKIAEVKASVDAKDVVQNNRIAELEAQIAAGGMTADEEAAVFAELESLKPTP